MMPSFRAYNFKTGTMHRVLHIYYVENHEYTPTPWVILEDNQVDYPKYKCGKDMALMQSTGLTDTHDTEIFEGDILENEYGRRAAVTWDLASLGKLSKQTHRATIIGNIYETPELLERTK